VTILDILALLLALAALFGVINHRFFGLPSTIGLMVIALAFSGGVLLVDVLIPGLDLRVEMNRHLGNLDFSRTLLDGALCFLLFAGALHINIDELLERRWAIGSLATVGLALSTVIVGVLSRGVFTLIGINVPWILCFLFGALISPTDPVAVLGVLKSTKAQPSLKAKIAGESLFNDGVAIVAFVMLTSMAGLGAHPVHGFFGVVVLFCQEALGGILLGLVLGYVVYLAMKSIDHYQVELILTLALVTGTISIATALHTSGPIAVVVAGLLIGNRGRRLAMSDVTVERLEMFWTLIDDLLNALLFLVLGLELFAISLQPAFLTAGVLMVPAVLISRLVSVGLPISLLKAARRTYAPGVIRILTWCGLRGGISVALVLSLDPRRSGSDLPVDRFNLILTCTYLVVLFSVIVQGLTVRAVIRGTEE